MPSSERLRVLFLTLFPPSPATFGAQRRIQGLLGSLARRHDVTAVSLLFPGMDPELALQGMRDLGAEAVVLPIRSASGREKRLVQLRSLASLQSFERRLYTLPELRRTLDTTLTGRRFDVVNVEFPFLTHYPLRQAPPGERLPRLVLDEHNVEFDLVRQMTGLGRGIGRHVHNSVNWRKVRNEEISAWKRFDGVMFTSAPDEARARALVPSIRARVVPNAVDVELFRPLPEHAPPDGRTVLFFGTFNYFPNHDGVMHFLREIWPILARSNPEARLKVIGADPPPEALAFQGERVEFAGLVPEVQPHIASAAVCVVPLRIGGGTRLKILEAMAMAKPIVSTRIGAEGIDATPGRELLLADDPPAFAAAVGCLLDDPALAARMGAAARTLVEGRYSWEAAGRDMDSFFRTLLESPPRT